MRLRFLMPWGMSSNRRSLTAAVGLMALASVSSVNAQGTRPPDYWCNKNQCSNAFEPNLTAWAYQVGIAESTLQVAVQKHYDYQREAWNKQYVNGLNGYSALVPGPFTFYDGGYVVQWRNESTFQNCNTTRPGLSGNCETVSTALGGGLYPMCANGPGRELTFARHVGPPGSLTWECTGCPEGRDWNAVLGRCVDVFVIPRALDLTSTVGACSSLRKDPPLGNPIYPLRGTKREVVDLGIDAGPIRLQLVYDGTLQAPRRLVSTGTLTNSAFRNAGSGASMASLNSGPISKYWYSTLHRAVASPNLVSGSAVDCSPPGAQPRPVRVRLRGDGTAVPVQQIGSGAFVADAHPGDKYLSTALGDYLYVDSEQNLIERYSAEGVLLSSTSATGGSVELTYSNGNTPQEQAPGPGYLVQTTDDRGRIAKLSYAVLIGRPGSAVLRQVTDAQGYSTQFGYDAELRLSSIAWPNGTSRQFKYENTSLPWALTAVVDESGTVSASFSYDTAGRALSTRRAGDTLLYSATYTQGPAIRMTDEYDASTCTIYRTYDWEAPGAVAVSGPQSSATSQWTSTSLNGKNVLTSQSQPAGSGCAASSSALGYDANGNVVSEDDFNGNRVCRAFDLGRNLETTEVQGLAAGTACTVTAAGAALPAGARKTSTQWHPDWRLKTKVAEPGRISTYVYNGQPDPFNANALASCAPAAALLPDGKPIAVLCRQVEQATTDANGSLGFTAALQTGVVTREQKWTYNERGQVLTHDGPRTDVVDITTYTYYSDTVFTGADPNAVGHTIGDLASVTNATGKVTNYTQYDKNGQLLQSVDANGVTTNYTYDARQRMTSTSVGGKTTTREYWPTGLLKKVTQPDTSFVAYEYDDAHRLKAVADNLDNRIEYTLDNAGTRTAENVKDPAGTLRRQLSRVPDALGRVQQTTGRE